MDAIPHLLVSLVASFFQAGVTPVLVVDQSGKPIAGARIEPVSLSINYPSVISDEEGRAAVPRRLQKVEWINVSKKGYQAKQDIKFQPSNPITVELRR